MLANVPAAAGRWAFYLVKAAALSALLYLFAQHVGTLPTWAIALVWVALSMASAVGATYHVVVGKTSRQHEFNEGGVLARINNARVLGMVVSTVLSAAAMAAFLLKSPLWPGVTWAVVAVAVPAYLVVSLLVDRAVGGEFKQGYRTSRVALLSTVCVTALLVLGYFACGAVQFDGAYASAREALVAVQSPFDASPSSLIAELGAWMAFANGVAAFGAAQVAGVSPVLYTVFELAFAVFSFWGVANLLSLCSLGWRELRRVFLPLEAVTGSALDAARPKVQRGAVKTALAMPLVLVLTFLLFEGVASRLVQTEEYSAMERITRDWAGVAASVLDGVYYEPEALRDLQEELALEAAALAEGAEAVLVPLINASYDARIANVDSYLDWYYSLPADYERLVGLVTGTVEEYVESSFSEMIEAGVDDSVLLAELESYWGQVDVLSADYEARLAACELTGVPEWLVVEETEVDPNVFEAALEPTEGIRALGSRLGMSAGTALGVGALAKHVVKKAAGGEFFQLVVKKITGMLGSKALGAAAGGAVGTLVGPLGTAAGVLVGGAASVGIDYGLLKLDEAWNREEHKAELVAALEADRAEMLAIIQGGAAL